MCKKIDRTLSARMQTAFVSEHFAGVVYITQYARQCFGDARKI